MVRHSGWLASALALAMCAPAFAQQDFAGWSALSAGTDEPEARVLACQGDDCADGTLNCTLVTTAGSLPEGAGTNDLMSGLWAWDQFDYWVAARFAADRKDLIGDYEELSEGAKQGPVLESIGAIPVVSVTYAVKAGEDELRVPVWLWVDDGALRVLRCSYRQAEGASAERAAALLAQVLGVSPGG